MRGAPVLLGFLLPALAGCGREVLPEPEAAAHRYAEAVQRGDAAAVRELMTARARAELDEAAVGRSLRENRGELGELARGLGACSSSRPCPSHARASLRFDDGLEATLVAEAGEFRVSGAGTLPAWPTTPESALLQLRWALRRGRPEGLLALLTPERRRALELDWATLEAALTELDVASFERRGERVEVTLSRGLRILLVRIDGAWRVEEIE